MISLRDFWYIVGESRDLGKENVLSAFLLDEWLAVYRDPEGRAVVVIDRCLHRNARLSRGRAREGQLVCPYHGWRYGAEGKLAAIPSDGPGKPVGGARCLTSFPTREKDGYIYARLNPTPAESLVGQEPFAIPYLHQPGYQHIRLKHVFRANVPNCAENFIDIPHTTYVHPNIFRYEKEPQAISTEVEVGGGTVHVRYLDETSNFGFFSAFLNRKNKKIFHEDHYYLPNVTHVEYRFGERRHFNITSQSIPVQTGETHVYTDLTYDYGPWNFIARPAVRWVAKKIIAQDVKIMGEQTDVTNKYGERFISSRADLHHVWIEKIYGELLAGRDPRALPPKKEALVFWI